MCTKGIYQLKRITLQYCDFGGSSKGVREFLESDILKDFMKKNPQIHFEFVMRKGFHPYITSSYINGYIKDQSLRNLKPEEILHEFNRYRNSFGRKHLPHAGKKVYGTTESIQGKWRPNMWGTYPIFELEHLKKIPTWDKVPRVIAYDRELENKKMLIKDPVNEFMRMPEPKKV